MESLESLLEGKTEWKSQPRKTRGWGRDSDKVMNMMSSK